VPQVRGAARGGGLSGKAPAGPSLAGRRVRGRWVVRGRAAACRRADRSGCAARRARLILRSRQRLARRGFPRWSL